MRRLMNNTTEHIDVEQHQALLEIEKLIMEKFKVKVDQVFINAVDGQPSRIGGLNFIFDKFEVRR